jgi:hypothetical protein
MFVFYFKDGSTVAADGDKHDDAWKNTGLPGKDYANVEFYTTYDGRGDHAFKAGWGPSDSYRKSLAAFGYHIV